MSYRVAEQHDNSQSLRIQHIQSYGISAPIVLQPNGSFRRAKSAEPHGTRGAELPNGSELACASRVLVPRALAQAKSHFTRCRFLMPVDGALPRSVHSLSLQA